MTTKKSIKSYVVPIEWVLRADALSASADIVWNQAITDSKEFIARAMEIKDPDEKIRLQRSQPSYPLGPHVVSIYCLLKGYAIENLLKAIYLCKKPQDVRNIRKLWSKRGHQLIWLAELAKVNLKSESEKVLLEKLTEYVLWRGRYPVDFSEERYAFSFGLHQGLLDKLYSRLAEEFGVAQKEWRKMAAQGVDIDGVPLGP